MGDAGRRVTAARDTEVGGTDMSTHEPVILFADRDSEWSRAIRAQLRERGFRVVTSESAAEALEAARHYAPDLVVLDYDLAGGFLDDVAGRLRIRSPRSAILLVSERALTDAEEICRRMGVSWYAVKPVEPSLFHEMAKLAVEHRTQAGPVRRRRTVLCVDDDDRFLGSLSRALAVHGYHVAAYGDSKRALDSLDEVRPDLAIVDVMMPGMDGLDLTREIRQRSKGQVPVILLTGLSSDEACHEGYERGAKYFLTKPCPPQRIFDVVDYFAGDLDDIDREVLRRKL